jgi:hypothetical protein
MKDHSEKSVSLDLFYPAPPGLPVPVKPKRGDAKLFQQIKSFDWNAAGGSKNSDLLEAGALWLHGFLPECHVIAQGNHTTEGSYWHALMHRSEGDFSNSIYWFRRVGKHAIFPALLTQTNSLMASNPESSGLLEGSKVLNEWRAEWFVNLCEQAYRGQFDKLNLLRDIATIEYNLLVKYCLDLQLG